MKLQSEVPWTFPGKSSDKIRLDDANLNRTRKRKQIISRKKFSQGQAVAN